jgi:hypothetical protein
MAVKLSARLHFPSECVELTKKYILGVITIAPFYASYLGFNSY